MAWYEPQPETTNSGVTGAFLIAVLVILTASLGPPPYTTRLIGRSATATVTERSSYGHDDSSDSRRNGSYEEVCFTFQAAPSDFPTVCQRVFFSRWRELSTGQKVAVHYLPFYTSLAWLDHDGGWSLMIWGFVLLGLGGFWKKARRTYPRSQAGPAP